MDVLETELEIPQDSEYVEEELERSSYKGNESGVDPIRTYIGDIWGPVPTRREERELFTSLEIFFEGYRRNILKVSHSARYLERVFRGKIRVNPNRNLYLKELGDFPGGGNKRTAFLEDRANELIDSLGCFGNASCEEEVREIGENLQRVGSLVPLNREFYIRDLQRVVEKGINGQKGINGVGVLWSKREHDMRHFELAKNWLKGYGEIKNKIVSKNLRLVANLAGGFSRESNDGYHFYQDLVQEGSNGLMRAVDKFEVNLGNKFSTLATWWIRQSLLRVYGRKRIENFRDAYSFDAHEIDLAEKVNEESESEPKSKNELTGMLNNALSILNPREREIVKLRFGLDRDGNGNGDESGNGVGDRDEVGNGVGNGVGEEDRDGKGYTLKEVGKIYGVTRERIRQIETRALNKMRMSGYMKGLEVFLE